MVLNGELVFYPELVKIHQEESYILSYDCNNKKSNIEVGSVADENCNVTNMSFGLPTSWSEVFYLSSLKEIEIMRKLLWSNNYKNKLPK